MTTNKIVIAIDGYSGCGKSSTAKAVAKAMNYAYIDTGAMYRAVTLFFIQNEISLSDVNKIKEAMLQIKLSFLFNKESQANEIYLNDTNVEFEIRKMYISEAVSPVSALKEVREEMVRLQRDLAKSKAVVMDGRDVGTVIFPKAELKIFMQANVEVRAERRKIELEREGQSVSLAEVISNFKERDRIDTSREFSPLRQAEDAILVDSTFLSFQEQVDIIIDKAKAVIENLSNR